MGKLKRKYNAKARQQDRKTTIDTSAEKRIHVDESAFNETSYDDSNALVLPAKKRKTKPDKIQPPAPKQLSKKKRKHLENVLQRREKKAKRGELLEALQKVQVDAAEIHMLTSTSDMQTRLNNRKLLIDSKDPMTKPINTIKGSNKKSVKLSTQNDGNDSDSSVNTSDITTEEEDNLEDKLEDNLDNKSDNKSPDNIDDNCEKQESDSDDNIDKNLVDASDLMDTSQNIDTEELDTKKDEATKKDEITKKADKECPASTYVTVNRSDEVQEGRLALPILSEEQTIMETITHHPVVIVCGETGSGKTTQVPQFLYEAGYALNDKMIAITEPRRVAAISMSQRVAHELTLTSREVSYQIRYEGNVTDDTHIKFLTDGVLLKEIQKDFLLSSYSAVIIDEAHERSVYTDILIGLLSRIVPLRNKRGKPLKLIIMSATLRVEDFTENTRLFKVKPPVIKVESRQFPVTIHFNKRTPQDDYIGEAYRKICKIHATLPEGGILVFVTGQQEVHTLCRRLRKRFPQHRHSTDNQTTKQQMTKNKKQSPETKNKTSKTDGKVRRKSKSKISSLPKIDLDNYTVDPYGEGEEAGDDSDQPLDSDDDDDAMVEREPIDSEEEDGGGCDDAMCVLPMFSLLPTHKQAQVFDAVPEGTRKVIVSTNVAETSLTIPDIKYVVDAGKVKEKLYDKVTGVSTFEVKWTSKASANQRAGRAGRMGPGHCYRLYSSAVFNDFTLFSQPEICRRPVDDLVLQMKAAEKLLVMLGALEMTTNAFGKVEDTPKITPSGHLMATLPVSPRYARMLAMGHQHGLLVYTVALVAALSVPELFVEMEASPDSDTQKEEQKLRRQQSLKIRHTWAGTGEGRELGDLMVLLKAVGSAEYEGCTEGFCLTHGIRFKAMREIRKLRRQLTNTVNTVIPTLNLSIDPKLPPPSDSQVRLLRQIVLAAHSDHVARRCVNPDLSQDKHLKHSYYSNELDDPIFIHPSSVLYKQNSDFVVYQQVVETSRLYMKGVSSIEPQWLPLLAASHCTLSAPLEKPPPHYDKKTGCVMSHHSCTYGHRAWPIPTTELEYPPGVDKYRWFARFLLEGLVMSSLAEFVPELLTAPVTMVKSWAKLQPRTETLLKALISRKVDSRQTLVDAWKANDKYLLSAYSEWLPQYLHDKLQSKWPPVT